MWEGGVLCGEEASVLCGEGEVCFVEREEVYCVGRAVVCCMEREVCLWKGGVVYGGRKYVVCVGRKCVVWGGRKCCVWREMLQFTSAVCVCVVAVCVESEVMELMVTHVCQAASSCCYLVQDGSSPRGHDDPDGGADVIIWACKALANSATNGMFMRCPLQRPS